MKSSSVYRFLKFGISTIMFKKKNPILGTIIVTDKCNITCKHCAVSNITSVVHPYLQIQQEMKQLYEMGIRILFFSGGETFLWTDSGKSLRDLVVEAKNIGFLIVNIVTNGTYPIDLPEADLILLSIDGDRDAHDSIRGETYDLIMENVKNATADNICFYMAINQLNKGKIRSVCERARQEKHVKAVSFNFNTPYPGTEELELTVDDKTACCNEISELMSAGYPIFNLKSAFPYIINNSFPTPCHQCVVMENGVLSTCGRCINNPGLCAKCGYFFVAEYTLIFQGNLRMVCEMLSTYTKYI
ncbi:MAG: radical SAM protein [Armatimonadota bacterium]